MPTTKAVTPGSLYVGVMSGTSLDGIDTVLVDLAATPKLIAHHHSAFAADLRQRLLALCSPGDDEINRLALADRDLGEAIATAVLELLSKTDITAKEVAAIGSHGQTIRHQSKAPKQQGFSLQIGDANTITARTGITTVCDFRRQDIAFGGQGAPLAPLFHAACFGEEKKSRAILNVGGMANITLLRPNEAVLGFDTGPGNVLLDHWIQRCRGEKYDNGGAWAATGKVLDHLHTALMAEPFLALSAPKSTGRELFNAQWLNAKLEQSGVNTEAGEGKANVQRTLLELTAQSIADALQAVGGADELYVCGGGAFNDFLLERLQVLVNATKRGASIPVASTLTLGTAPEHVEAVAFAWLAQQRLLQAKLSSPSITGAEQQIIPGGIYTAVSDSDTT